MRSYLASRPYLFSLKPLRQSTRSTLYYGLSGLVLAASLTSCAVTPTTPADGQSAWPLRQAQLAQMTHWQVTGRIGVISGQDGWHAHFQWDQQESDYRIDLMGPLGQGRILIQGDPQQVRLQTQDGQQQIASDPDTLLEQSLGVRLPVNGLRYWIRGLPAPGPVSALQTDSDGRLTHLEQNGWTIDYPAYSSATGNLPAQILAQRQELSVKLAIEQWQR